MNHGPVVPVLLEAAVIETWLSPELADPVRRAALRAQFLADPARIMVIDNALLPERYALLSQALRDDCTWEVRHGVRNDRLQWVDVAGFDGIAEDHRMYRHSAFARPRVGRELSPGMLGLVQFKLLLASAAGRDLLESLTGRRVTALQEMLVRRMAPGDLARPHDDAIEGRQFCLLVYFSDNWTPVQGGRFVLHAADGDRYYDPLPNRMILFDVAVRQDHSVQALAAVGAGGEVWRYNFSIWFR